jgi:hypothetical protein
MSPSDDRGRARRKRRVLDRVVALRRAGAAEPAPAEHQTAPPAPAPEDLQRLRERLDALESAFEGLQDAVHRESERHDREVADLRRQLQPAEMARSLSRDARERGL